MKLKSFFWQVFFALVLLCLSTVVFYEKVYRSMPNQQGAAYLTALLVLGISFFIAYRLSRPLQVLRQHLGDLAEGHLANKLKNVDTDLVEIHQLADAMEKVRNQMQSRIHMITIQKSEQDALLASMAEGVIAVDQDMKVLHVNRAAGQILSVAPKESMGQILHEVVRVTEVLDAVEQSLKQKVMVEKDIELSGRPVKYLQLHISPMQITEDNRHGAVLVFSDVSRIRELEGMRRNFVANVSHELKTPLTSIQGFAETVMNPAVTDPKEIKKFVEIIQRHSNRLGKIIEDILTLSRIERGGEESQIELKRVRIQPVVSSAIELCLMKAKQKNIELIQEGPTEIEAKVDASLLEQAVINLVDNAIRYSSKDSKVRVIYGSNDSEFYLRVIDSGVGIEKRLLARIFERFYRVDRARTRDLGGTGLGLSIVKHIVLAHKGRVEVESEIGQGSTFSIILPSGL